MKIPTKEQIEKVRQEYPAGTRIELIQMVDEKWPVQAGTKGTVKDVDDMLNIHMHWDNGRSLAMIYGVDKFRKIEEEKA